MPPIQPKTASSSYEHTENPEIGANGIKGSGSEHLVEHRANGKGLEIEVLRIVAVHEPGQVEERSEEASASSSSRSVSARSLWSFAR